MSDSENSAIPPEPERGNNQNNLHTRIAAVLYARDGFTGPFSEAEEFIRRDCLNGADAVIAELGLRREWGALDDEDNGVLSDTRDQLLPMHKREILKSRYITDWVPAGNE